MAFFTVVSSPASDASPPGSPMLTPRSKLKALLAAMDDDSDKEDAEPIVRKTLFKSTNNTIAKGDGPSQEFNHSQDDENEDDEDDIVRPRGRIAARMQGLGEEEESKQPKSPLNLASETIKKTGPKTQTIDEVTATTGRNDEDDEANTVITRRRIRPARSVTPEVTAIRDNSPASPGLFVSPSPHKSNASHHSVAESDSDDDLPANPSKSARFQALVARKREERLAKEAEEKRIRDERVKRMAEQLPDYDDDDDDDVSDISDDEGGRKLTQQVSRPTARKASKKALEEMNRETQRLSRSLQLAHEAKTKKKISKSTLFERFNFKPAGGEMQTEILATRDAKLSSSSRPTTPVSAAQTDVEAGESGTPPSSPPSVLKKFGNPVAPVSETTEKQQHEIIEDGNVDLPDLQASVAELQADKLDKGKKEATLPHLQSSEKLAFVKPKRQVRVKLPMVQANMVIIDSDPDELQITNPKKQSKIDSIFNRVPTQKNKESHSMHALRQLAHVSSSPPPNARKKNQKPSMTVGELQLNLQQRARAQGKLERERRLELLKSKGIHVQTEEEREKEREQVEDIVLRARQEAEEIMAREREDAKKAKKERRENGEADQLDWDDSDDDSFADSEAGTVGEEAEIEFSGSDEDEKMDDELDEEENDDEDATGNPMFDEDAEEDEESEVAPQATVNLPDDVNEDDEMDDVQPTKSRSRRSRKRVQIVSDDEDQVPVEATPKPKTSFFTSPTATHSPSIPTSVLRSASKTFIPGLPVPAAGPAGLGLTQIFAGTMDDSQAGLPAPTSGSPVEFMPSFDNFPDSQFSATAGTSQAAEDMILDSQAETQNQETQTQSIQLHFSQSQTHGFDSLMQVDGTQMSDLLNPTQDVGFADYTPLKERFIEPPQSTIGTVLLNGSSAVAVEGADQLDSPLVRKRGKLRRRGEVSFAEDSTIPPTETPGSPFVNAIAVKSSMVGTADNQEDPEHDGVSAFKLMAKAARKKKRAQEKFDKKKSKANAMVEVQAEESEDEYAGLGGADGEDSSDEEGLEELKEQMIDDKDGNDMDEGKLAAFFADRERAADSAQVDKLFRDITTGMLRKRRRGGGAGNDDFDLSDSDDGGEARRRLKRKQFAKMQKALFADERIGKIAENPRNSAFLKSIEDRGSDDEWNFDENFADDEPGYEEESQSQEASKGNGEEAEDRIPDSQPCATANLGRKRTRADPSEFAVRPAPYLRKTKDGVKPSSISDVRRSLSSLLGDPNGSVGSIIPATNPDSDSEEDEQDPTVSTSSNKENRRRGSVAVVDRISLKRSGSSSMSNTSTSSRLAFAKPTANVGASSTGLFKVPALLRRATTNSLISQTSSSSSTTETATTVHNPQHHVSKAAGFGEDAKLKKSAGKRSGINYFARESERREKMKNVERKREERKWKGVEGRGKVVGGLFGGGQFE